MVNQKKNQGRLGASRHLIKSLKAEADAKRNFSERVADKLVKIFSGMPFLIINITWFILWLIINVGWISGIKPFDPYPFILLTTTVSLEAIILSIVVLISQEREEKINDLRAEVDLQLDTITEKKLEKAMELLVKLAEKNGINVSRDPTVEEVLKPTDVSKIEQKLEKQIEKTG